jgi:uncharacterized repeat protein (TIGR01451 family)
VKRTIPALTTILFLTAFAGPAAAQDTPIEIQSSALVEKTVVNEKGEKELVRQSATKVLPGEEVIFINTYINKGEAPADDVVINNAITNNFDFIFDIHRGRLHVKLLQQLIFGA